MHRFPTVPAVGQPVIIRFNGIPWIRARFTFVKPDLGGTIEGTNLITGKEERTGIGMADPHRDLTWEPDLAREEEEMEQLADAQRDEHETAVRAGRQAPCLNMLCTPCADARGAVHARAQERAERTARRDGFTGSTRELDYV
ncbi:hypothetical protein ACFCZ3_20175 [Cellulosimicrobium cellulans]|uniref:hypothetical protein n=1 Tax=Cellulosimicrobium cellulans TaxID=1710 RepID=UPI0035E20BED